MPPSGITSLGAFLAASTALAASLGCGAVVTVRDMEGFQLPPRKKLSEFLDKEAQPAGRGKPVFAQREMRPPRKGKCWTDEEHLAFLAGLKKLGKGNWTGIARYYVPTRTSTQIASHAQKYLQRVTGSTKRKSKFSDIEHQVQTSSLADDVQPVWPLPDGVDMLTSGSAPARMSSDRRESGGSTPEAAPARRPAKALRPTKPTALRPCSSEPDLLRLAESLMSLSDPARTLSSARTSAFTRSASGHTP